MDKKHKQSSNDFMNDPQSYSQGEHNSLKSVGENASERLKRRRPSYCGENEGTAIIAERQSQDSSSQVYVDPLQSFATQPSASQLLLHVVLRCMVAQLRHDLPPSTRNEVPMGGDAFSNQRTGACSSAQTEDRLRGGSFGAEQSHSFLSHTIPNQTTSNIDHSSTIQNVISILLQRFLSPQQTAPPHSQVQPSQWIPRTNHAPPWSSQERVACASYPESSSVPNQESIMSVLTQSTSRFLGQEHGYGFASYSSTSGPSSSGAVPGLPDMLATLLQSTRADATNETARSVGDRSNSIDGRINQEAQLDLSQVLRQLSTPGSGPSPYLSNSSQNPFRGLSGNSSTSTTHNADSGRILTELLLQASAQRTTDPQNVHSPLSHGQAGETELERLEETDVQRRMEQSNPILAMSCDKDMLSPYQCLVRKQIELFEATQEDINTNAQGRNRPIVLGQVGIRCRHCSFLALHLRSRGSTYYPSTAIGLYQAAQNLASGHLCEHCRNIPASVRDELNQLRERKSSAGGGKKYWADGVRSFGVIEDADGLRFVKD